MRLSLFICFLFILPLSVWTQDDILRNSSFEQTDSSHLLDWIPCNLASTPDIQPGIWNVIRKASSGKNYVSLVTREDESVEAIGQFLKEPLQIGKLYVLSLDLAFTEDFSLGFDSPVHLKIWFGQNSCEKRELVWKSPTIDHESWEAYQFEFAITQSDEAGFIILEADYVSNTAYDGHILIDNLTLLESEFANDCEFKIPNAFTPDGDGLNDRFGVVGACLLADFYLRIFNRWGKVVYESNDFRTGWDGNLHGEAAPVDVYGWVMQYIYFQNGIEKTELRKGNVTLLR